MTAAAASPPASNSSWRKSIRLVMLPALLAILVLAAAVAATIGAAGIPVHRLAAAMGLTHGDPALVDRDWLVPRIAMAIIVGGLLAASGALLKGMFRNPLADPALVGVSNGAAFASAATIIAGDRYLAMAGATLPVEVLPLAAFAGALAATMILYRIATHEGRTIQTLGIDPVAMASIVPSYLWRFRKTGQFGRPMTDETEQKREDEQRRPA